MSENIPFRGRFFFRKKYFKQKNILKDGAYLENLTCVPELFSEIFLIEIGKRENKYFHHKIEISASS